MAWNDRPNEPDHHLNEHILIVEDEPAIRELVAINLRHAGFRVSEAADAAIAQSILSLEPPDLIVLDWMLPGTSGVDLAKRMREGVATRSTPIIMLTARAQEGDKLQGFEAGADDYVTKPFSPRELIARIKALLRRASPDEASAVLLEAGSLRWDPNSRRVLAGGTAVELSPTEFNLLGCFMRNAERVMSRARLLDAVWGNGVFIEERTVDVHIRRLRLALRPSGMDRTIETVRGGGYRFSTNATAGTQSGHDLDS